MKTLVRYSVICCAFLFISLVILFLRLLNYPGKSTLNSNERRNGYDQEYNPPFIKPLFIPILPENCTSLDCLSVKNCETLTLSVKNFERSAKFQSMLFKRFVQAVKNLPFFIGEISKNEDFNSCFTLFNIDVLDRDILNPTTLPVIPDFSSAAKFMKVKLDTNYVFFNLFSGTYPDYSEKVDFDVGRGILMKSSVTHQNFRAGYDIAFPLVNVLKHELLPKPVTLLRRSSTTQDRYLATFKGKRYVQGIGSETRDLLPVISNQKDILSLVTCEHNRDEWKKHLNSIEMQQCEANIREYHRPQFDYDSLLLNSTFCFVPRGRRADSFRLLEVMRSGCIPVVLSNNVVLPFSEVIQWEKLAVIADERLVTLLPSYLRNIGSERVLAMRAQAVFIYNAYFSSMDTILRTTFKILFDRISPKPLPRWIWNSYPGALFVDTNYSTDFKHDYPFWSHYLNEDPVDKRWMYSVVVVKNQDDDDGHCEDVAREALNANNLNTVFLFSVDPDGSKLHIEIDDKSTTDGLRRVTVNSLYDVDLIVSKETSHIVTMNCTTSTDNLAQKLRFLTAVSGEYPDRLIGYDLVNHFLSSAWTNEYAVSSDVEDYYSMVNVTNMAIHHKYYYHLLRTHFNSSNSEQLRSKPHCASVFLNMMIAYVTQNPPIGLKFIEDEQAPVDDQVVPDQYPADEKGPEDFSMPRESECLQWFKTVLGYIPLRHSSSLVRN